MRSERRGGFGAVLMVLLVAGAVIKFWMWIVGIAAAAALAAVLVWTAAWIGRRAELAAKQRSGLAARADEQHAQIMAGDDRGIYGDFPPAVPSTPPTDLNGFVDGLLPRRNILGD